MAAGQGLQVGDEIVRIVSGSVHYWRIDEARWPQVLGAVRELGFSMIDTYVPWSRHERASGAFDFAGRLDVERFLRLADEVGLRVLVRPGPHINAELPDFGFPRRVLWDPACQARSSAGTPIIIHSRSEFFPAPSYAAPAFLREVGRWYDAVIPRLAALQWPDGPVVACQVDNEMGYFFHIDPFVFDYRPEFVESWQRAAGTSDPAPVDGRAPADLVASWVRHKEDHLRDRIDLLAEWIVDRGMDRVPLFHNDFPALAPPLDQAALEASGAVAIAANDLYVQRENLQEAKDVARTLAGSSTLPFIAELGSGWVADPIGIPQRILPPDEEAALLAVLLCGVRAWNFYMLVEREHWYGSPIDREGRLVPEEAALYRRMHDVLGRLDWWSLTRDAPVLLLHNRDIERDDASCRIAGATAAVLDGRQLPSALRSWSSPHHATFLEEWRTALERCGLDFSEGSTDAPPSDLDRFAAVVVCDPPPGVSHPNLLTGSPTVDQVSRLPRPAYPFDGPSGVSIHRFTGPRGQEVIGALNASPSAATFSLELPEIRRLTPTWRPDADAVLASSVELSLPPHSGEMWEVTSR